jgi:broad specificity phosphatase PhoE
MPEFGETVEEARIRYNNIIQAIANMYPGDNILLVTHGGYMILFSFPYIRLLIQRLSWLLN